MSAEQRIVYAVRRLRNSSSGSQQGDVLLMIEYFAPRWRLGELGRMVAVIRMKWRRVDPSQFKRTQQHFGEVL